MKKITIRKISFASYVKFYVISGIGMGVVLGLIFFLIGIFGAPVRANVGSTNFAGLGAAAIGAILFPIIGMVPFLWFSVISYLPFKLILKIIKGMEMNIEVQDDESEIS